MSDPETNPELAEQTNLETEAATNPEGSATAEAVEESQGATEESSTLTPEQLQDYQAFKASMDEANITDPKEFAAEFTRRSQLLNTQQHQLSQYQQSLAAFTQQQQAAQDPVFAAEQALSQAETSWDADAIRTARQQWRTAVAERTKQEAVQAAMQAQRVQAQMQEAQQYGAVSEQDLIPIANSLTATELGMVKAAREGRLHEVLNKQQERQTEQAQRAARMNRMLGQGAGGIVPGALAAQGDEAPINPSHWLGMSEAARKRKFGDVEPRIE